MGLSSSHQSRQGLEAILCLGLSAGSYLASWGSHMGPQQDCQHSPRMSCSGW